MARRCTTVPGFGRCCAAFQQGIQDRFTFTDSRGTQRCARCSIRQSQSKNPQKRGRNVFHFEFLKNSVCGIGPGGCPVLTPGQGQGQLSLPGPTQVPTL